MVRKTQAQWCDARWAAVVEAQIPAVVAMNRRMFAHFPEFDAEDLLSEARLAACRAVSAYQPALSSPATFVKRVARSRLIDLYRQARRRHRRDFLAADAKRMTADRLDPAELSGRYHQFGSRGE